MALTDTACCAAKGGATDYKLSDGGALSPCETKRLTALESGVPVQRKAEETLSRRLSFRIARRGAPAARRGQEAVGLWG